MSRQTKTKVSSQARATAILCLAAGLFVVWIIVGAVYALRDGETWNVVRDPLIEQRFVELEESIVEVKTDSHDALKNEVAHLRELLDVHYKYATLSATVELAEVGRKRFIESMTPHHSYVRMHSVPSQECVEVCSKGSCEWDVVTRLIKEKLVKVLPSGRICVRTDR